MYLTNRLVAPALAVGNVGVVKPATDTPVTGGLLLAKIYEEAGLRPSCSTWSHSSFVLYFLFSLVFFPLALLVAYMVDDRRLAPA